VKDFSVLKSIQNLKLLWCDYVPERDAAIIRSLKSLERINDKASADFFMSLNDGKR